MWPIAGQLTKLFSGRPTGDRKVVDDKSAEENGDGDASADSDGEGSGDGSGKGDGDASNDASGNDDESWDGSADGAAVAPVAQCAHTPHREGLA